METSSYPAPEEQANFKLIPNLTENFGVKLGLSSYTIGSAVEVGSVTLGMTMVVKHFILHCYLLVPDATFSIEPIESKKMVEE